MNNGQLKTVLRDQYLVDARPVTKVSGPAVQDLRDRGCDRDEALQMNTFSTSPLLFS
jgi:hypothetical protein